MSAITKWEYRQEIYQGPELLNKWGGEGWEVTCTIGKEGSFLILKRPIVTKRRTAELAAASAATGHPAGAGASAGGSGSGSGASPNESPKKKFKELI